MDNNRDNTRHLEERIKHEMMERKYILWRRVSTKGQGDSGLGLEAQVSIARYFMKAAPEKVFTDVYTGTNLKGCTELWEAIRYAKSTGYLLVVAKTDRFRNVKEALEILDVMGEGNLSFCDLPSTDRMILTIVFAVWEKQAMIGRLNTKLALEERKKEIARNGHFISKAGNVCTHLGREKGCDTSKAREVAAELSVLEKKEWQENSPAYKFARRKFADGWNSLQVLEELKAMEADSPGTYRTRRGAEITSETLRKWKMDMGLPVSGTALRRDEVLKYHEQCWKRLERYRAKEAARAAKESSKAAREAFKAAREALG